MTEQTEKKWLRAIKDNLHLIHSIVWAGVVLLIFSLVREETFSKFIDSIAWPVTVLLIFFVLRKPIISLINHLGQRVTKVMVGGAGAKLEVEMTPEEQKAAERLPDVNELPEKPSFGQKTVTTIEEITKKIASIHPQAAITFAWLQVKNALAVAAVNCNAPMVSRSLRSPLKDIEYLKESKEIGEAEADILNYLAKVGQHAVHYPDKFTYKSATLFGDLSGKAVNLLTEIEGTWGTEEVKNSIKKVNK